MNKSIALILSVVLLLVSGCNSTPKKQTLRDLDVVSDKTNNNNVFVKPKTDDDTRNAYSEYLKHASKSENTRMAAIFRLAELEYELSNKMMQEQESLNNEHQDEIKSEQIYNDRLQTTINLLETSLKDYPDSKNNDNILYQLAKAYDHNGQHDKSIEALRTLAMKYPKSPYYIEAQFRIGEEAFSYKDYIRAEDAYGQVITTQRSDIFYEKALFKRGWSRFKQELYIEAVDDYLRAVSYHEFDDVEKLNKSEKDQFDEYFRAIGLAFSYLGGAESLRDYFSSDPDFKYVYHSYSTVSDIYLKQERFSDAVDTLKQFNQYYPQSENIPYADLKTIGVWKNSDFTNKFYDAMNDFYKRYNPDSEYWKTNINKTINKSITNSLRDYILLVSSYYHNKYQQKRKSSNFENADLWYQRYLKHYQATVHKDNIYYLYAELLAERNHRVKALKYYELAAYDSDLVLDKKAAYATIVVTDQLYNQSKQNDNDRKTWLNKHIKYALLYSQLYPLDKQTSQIVLHAAELAYSSRQYNKAIELTSLLSDTNDSKILLQANTIKAQSYFNTENYSQAEQIFLALLSQQIPGSKEAGVINDKLALSIYKQAEKAKSANNIAAANANYIRIQKVAPGSEIAATGMYDAIALSISNNLWTESIQYIKSFQQLYPNHKNSTDVTKKLSIAYLNSNQDIKAAQEFEKISNLEQNMEVKIAALWQAAELYEAKTDYVSAIRSYKQYAEKFKKPYPQYMEAMNKLVELNNHTSNPDQITLWRKKIVEADKSTSKKYKTDRTKYIASISSIGLARSKHEEFTQQKLVKPFKVNLRKKKNTMQAAVKFFAQASTYGISETVTEATHSIAKIYKDFSVALLNSERPTNLNEEELEQYEILLEDQAFPFEDKSIEFFETNLSRVKEGIFNEWIEKSHAELKQIFPVRYNRETRMDDYINAIY